MEGVSFLELTSTLWPIFLAFLALIFSLAKSHTDISVLQDKVRVLYELVNKLMQDKK
tara:strand:+ start:374 stop:544 length:171 start_codon:yes stop_codon:yes gene_type:complete